MIAAAHLVGGAAADQTADLEPRSPVKHPTGKNQELKYSQGRNGIY